MGAMGNTPPIWVYGVGDISTVSLSCWILYICVLDPDWDFAPPHKDYPLHHVSFCVRVFDVISLTVSLNPTKHGIRDFVLLLFSSSSLRRVQCIAFGRG